MAFRVKYFTSPWNQFDLIILIMSIIDLALDQTILRDTNTSSSECIEETESLTTSFSPSVLRVAKVVRLLRILRSLRLVRGLIPQLIEVLNKQINKQLRLGYDVGKGYIMGEEEVHDFLDHMVDNQAILMELKTRITTGKLVILKELGLLQKEHPGVAVSVKTQQAARRILNNLREKIVELKGEGTLDEAEALKLDQVRTIKVQCTRKPLAQLSLIIGHLYFFLILDIFIPQIMLEVSPYTFNEAYPVDIGM